MWNPYQYRQGKLKLIKDLKTGQPHLRISLIDHQEINDLTKIYQERKDYYKIQSTTAVVPQFIEETYQEQAISNLSYKEKIDMYRKKLQSQKMQHKYSNLFKKVQKKKSNLRNPVLHKLLQHFQTAQKIEEEANIQQDIKESQKNLQMIKINSNRRAFFSQKSTMNNVARPRFISLQNSLPEKQVKAFPKWTDYSQGRYLKPDNNNKSINITALQNNLEAIIGKKISQPDLSHNTSQVKQSNVFRQKSMTEHKLSHSTTAQFDHSHQKQKHRQYPKQNEKEQNNFILIDQNKKRQVMTADVYEKFKQIDKLDKSILNRTTSKPRTTQSKRFYKHKTNENITHAIKTFSKSQHYSKEVIDTMSGFYKTKVTKKEDYQKMVHFLKNDRPFTSDIRRRNYKMIGQQNLKHVKQYRNISQKQRKKIRQQNFKFYIQLLKKMQDFNNDELALSGKIIQKIRVVLQSNYYLDASHYEAISEPALYEKRDPMSEELLSSVEKLMKRQNKDNQK